VTVSGVLKTIAYSALKTLLNAIYARLPLIKTLDDAATIAVDCEDRYDVRALVVQTATRAVGQPSNAPVGCRLRLSVEQGGAGGWQTTFHADYKFVSSVVPTQITTAGRRSTFEFVKTASDVWEIDNFVTGLVVA